MKPTLRILATLCALASAAAPPALAQGFTVTPVDGAYGGLVRVDCQERSGSQRLEESNAEARAEFFITPLLRCSTPNASATALVQVEAKGKKGPTRNRSPGFKITLDASAQVWKGKQGSGVASHTDYFPSANRTTWKITNPYWWTPIGVAMEYEFNTAPYELTPDLTADSSTYSRIAFHADNGRYDQPVHPPIQPRFAGVDYGTPLRFCLAPGKSLIVTLSGNANAAIRSLGPRTYQKSWTHIEAAFWEVPAKQNCADVAGPPMTPVLE